MSGDQRQGTVAQVVGAASDMAKSLPPSFIALLFINIIFIGMIFLLLDRAAQHRSDLIDHILAACTVKMEQK